MEDVVSYYRQGSIGVITVDNPPVNALSQQVRAGILRCLDEGLADDEANALVLTCAGRTFIAGADITEFGKPPLEPELGTVVKTLEASPKIIVAALFGTTLGGGFEVALGCHYRIANKLGRVGFPEVLLGILPGASGTQRMPRLAGVQAALECMVSGKPISAKFAKEMGAIDEIVDESLLEAAISYAETLVDKGAQPRRVSEMQVPKSDPAVFEQFVKATAKHTRGYFAPPKIVEAVKAAVDLDFDQGLLKERELFTQCMKSPESSALRYLFFAERKASKVNDLEPVDELRKINKVGVIGAGTMGGGIAMNFASKGVPVALVDVSEDAIERGLSIVRGNYARGLKKGRMTEAQLEDVMSLFIPTTNYSNLADCDLIIEAVFENMALKKKIFEQLDRAAKPGAILASNTSTLDVDEIAGCTERPEDVIGLHFFSPANVMRLLEVVRGSKTSAQVLTTCMKLAKRIGKVGVVSGVCYGFIGNRMLEGYARESGFLHLEGASAQQIDNAIYQFGFPMGPMAMGDLAGIDVGAKVRDERRIEGLLPDDPRYGVVADKLVALGRFGQKTSAGFYRYEKGSRVPIPDPDVEAIAVEQAQHLGIQRRDISDQEIVSRCMLPLINEGARILEEGIAQRASDIDIVWINGYGFPPYRGGPMFYADALGLSQVYDSIVEYQETLGDEFDYWRPSALLKDLATSGKKFSDL